MAFFGKIFGKKEIPPTPQDAIQKLRDTEEILMKKTEFLEKKIESEIATARKHGTKNKRMALQALKRKKMYEKQLQQVDGTLSTLEYQRESLENATSNVEVLSTMEHAAKALQAAHKQIDVDKVHDMMDDIAEHAQMVDEISDILAKSNNLNYDIDEDELLAELEELEQEDLNEELLKIAPPPVDVVVPPLAPKRTKKKGVETDTSREFAELEAWAAAS